MTSQPPIEIAPCPPHRRGEAMRLVLGDFSDQEQFALIDQLPSVTPAGIDPLAALAVARSGERIVGACWLQPMLGELASWWPPRVETGWEECAADLIRQSQRLADDAGWHCCQALLGTSDVWMELTLEECGYRLVGELEYLGWSAAPLPDSPRDEVWFAPVPSEAALVSLVDRTYEGSLDCPALSGARTTADTLAGYRSTGTHRPELWKLAMADEEPVGVLLLTAYPENQQLELVYMGLVPEARGRRWGHALIRQAQRTTVLAGMNRLVTAVDIANTPAVAGYRACGLVPFARRRAWIRGGPEIASLRFP